MNNAITRKPGTSLQDFQLVCLAAARDISTLAPSDREAAFHELTHQVNALREPDEQLGNLFSRLYEAARIGALT